MENETFESTVMNAELNENYEFRGIMFIINSENGEYCWSAKRSGRISWSYPMKNSQYVKKFKTLNGVKRSLIKHFYPKYQELKK